MSDTKPTAAEVAIDAIREYFEDRQDASMEPGEDRFHGNKEMALLEEVGTVEAALSSMSEVTRDRDDARGVAGRLANDLQMMERENDALRKAGKRALAVLRANGQRAEPGNVLGALEAAIGSEFR